MNAHSNYVRWLEDLGSGDLALVGGKNASLGEMITAMRKQDIAVPNGFATTAAAYREFLAANQLEEKIADLLEDHRRADSDLAKTGKAVRRLINRADFPEERGIPGTVYLITLSLV